jgi:hypothetical protein
MAVPVTNTLNGRILVLLVSKCQAKSVDCEPLVNLGADHLLEPKLAQHMHSCGLA